MLKLLIENPLLLLFIVAAIGYPLGKVKVYGISLGVGAVLFVGIAIGSLHRDLKAPEIVYVLGQALFVYTVGLAAGPAFVGSLRRDGIRNNILVAVALILAAAACLGFQKFLHLPAGVAAGMYAGSFTTSPALAGILDTIKQTAPADQLEQLLADPVVGFSVTYPIGVIGVVLAISLAQRLWKTDYRAEAQRLRNPSNEEVEDTVQCTFRVHSLESASATVEEMGETYGWKVLFGRVKRGDRFFVCTPETVFKINDLVIVTGTREELMKVGQAVGERRKELRVDASEYAYRRIFVSNPQVTGRPMRELNLRDRFGEVVTSVRRGDDEFVPSQEAVLELGDVVRVLAHQNQMKEVAAFFGNSYKKVSEVDVMTFSLGLVIGLCVGLIPIPFPGGSSVKLGFAGGPLVVALILGTFGRTGGMVWTLPYAANMTLRQIGLVLFLAGIGTRAGYTFVSTLSRGGGISIFVAGAILTTVTAFSVLWIGHRLFKIPMSLVSGMVAGMHTQIAVLGFAKDQTGNDLPDQGYASVYAVSTIGKILLVHMILALQW
ncbi:aspartate:alanine exchanger family transporter [Geomesophilobacter sediminis]|uniref:Transporter n=1 Tax=Geomesophilobacter sediminis TaxID=2798584 RepID=A0A8J7S6P2_9BACT|nr:aspartate:alanine exchanger family transporter [Geomesophilobacter sediminis]MBJ6726536.1 transporter [Geomesophilobacter sediminis]